MSTIYERLRNYRDFLARVDQICREIETAFAPSIACHAGCNGCCRHISLFPVEAAALTAAVGSLPPDQASHVRARALGTSPDGPCPLLENGRCLLYEARPIICRTHGLPVLTLREGKKTVDFCPKNFLGIRSLPGTAVIDLDRLNTTLAAIDTLFVQESSTDSPRGSDRMTIAEAIAAKL